MTILTWAPGAMSILLTAVLTVLSAQDRPKQSPAAGQTDLQLAATHARDLVSQLKSAKEWSDKVDALQQLRKMGPLARSAAPELVRMLGSGQPYGVDRGDIVEVLVAVGGPDAIAGLVDALGDDNDDVGTAASKALASMGSAAIVPLVSALGNERNNAPSFTVTALVQIGEPAVPALVGALSDRRPMVQALAMSALVEIGEAARPAFPKMRDMEKHPDKYVRYEAVQACLKFDATGCVPIFARLTADSDVAVRRVAIEAIGKTGKAAIGAESALLAAIAAASDQFRSFDDAWICETAATALGAIGASSDETIETLRRLLSEGSERPRIAAAMALAEIGGPARKAIPDMEKLLLDSSPLVRSYARKALDKLRAAK